MTLSPPRMEASVVEQQKLGAETECAPASPRDWLVAQVAIRLGRLNRFDLVLRARRQAVSLLAREGFTALAKFPMGIELYLPCWDNGLAGALLARHVFEPMPVSIFQSVVRPGAVVIDGGAHVGFYAILAAKLMQGRGTIIAFEPDPRNFLILQRNIARNEVQSTIRAECTALSDFDGAAEMWIADDISTCGSLVNMDLASHRSIPIQSTCLDSYLSTTEISKIDLLKLDLEGAEPICLRGARRAVKLANFLLFELNAPRLKAQGLVPQDVLREFLVSGCFTEAILFDEIRQRAVRWNSGPELSSLLEAAGFVNVLLSKQKEVVSLDASGA
jgi:FkbM family methyltransferase